jgi:transcriptional regulator with PAS, ATPase and Fis domain
MSLLTQAKFLRVLQEREFQRLGGTRVLRTAARIVAATNRDLQKAITNSQFRDGLFYRLNVFAIQLPPLRDRRDDILPLTQAFLTEFGRAFANPPAGISREAREMLLAYPWPGNIRELRNLMERLAYLSTADRIEAEDLALILSPHGQTAASSPTITWRCRRLPAPPLARWRQRPPRLKARRRRRRRAPTEGGAICSRWSAR